MLFLDMKKTMFLCIFAIAIALFLLVNLLGGSGRQDMRTSGGSLLNTATGSGTTINAVTPAPSIRENQNSQH